jgi:mannose-6-phosphate isomerase-like protein (cupin superfamily)
MVAYSDLHITSHKEDKMDKNYSTMELGPLSALGRTTMKDALGLTGTEASANKLPAGKAIPFVHSHKRNEELYLVASGRGTFWIDGEKVPLREGTALRVAPAGKRCIKADEGSDLVYFCIQAEAGSLAQCTKEDGAIGNEVPSWE